MNSRDEEKKLETSFLPRSIHSPMFLLGVHRSSGTVEPLSFSARRGLQSCDSCRQQQDSLRRIQDSRWIPTAARVDGTWERHLRHSSGTQRSHRTRPPFLPFETAFPVDWEARRSSSVRE